MWCILSCLRDRYKFMTPVSVCRFTIVWLHLIWEGWDPGLYNSAVVSNSSTLLILKSNVFFQVLWRISVHRSLFLQGFARAIHKAFFKLCVWKETRWNEIGWLFSVPKLLFLQEPFLNYGVRKETRWNEITLCLFLFNANTTLLMPS